MVKLVNFMLHVLFIKIRMCYLNGFKRSLNRKKQLLKFLKNLINLKTKKKSLKKFFIQLLKNFLKIVKKMVIQLQLSAFSPHPSTPSQPNPPPSPASTRPLDFVHVSFIVVPVIPSPHYPFPTPLWLLLDCS